MRVMGESDGWRKYLFRGEQNDSKNLSDQGTIVFLEEVNLVGGGCWWWWWW